MEAPANRLDYQSMILHMWLECRSPAAPRMAELIKTMSELGRSARSEDSELRFPIPILEPQRNQQGDRLTMPMLAALYPRHPVLSCDDETELARSLVYARQENDFLKAELARRRVGYWLAGILRGVYSRIRGPGAK
jgi:hypothetical protein